MFFSKKFSVVALAFSLGFLAVNGASAASLSKLAPAKSPYAAQPSWYSNPKAMNPPQSKGGTATNYSIQAVYGEGRTGSLSGMGSQTAPAGKPIQLLP